MCPMSNSVKEIDSKESEKKDMDEKESVRKKFEEKHSSNKNSEDTKANQSTYINIVNDEESKMLEMDLVFIRQRGVDEKFLEITLTEMESVGNDTVPVRKVKEIKTKEEFDKIKNYFVNLYWD